MLRSRNARHSNGAMRAQLQAASQQSPAQRAAARPEGRQLIHEDLVGVRHGAPVQVGQVGAADQPAGFDDRVRNASPAADAQRRSPICCGA
jgi:hypothetical protein